MQKVSFPFFTIDISTFWERYGTQSEGDWPDTLVVQIHALPGVFQDTPETDILFIDICVLFNNKSDVLQNRIKLNLVRI